MNKRDFTLDINRLMDMLETHFDKTCEIVLHDLTKPYDHTIIDIRNGHITGRTIGDSGTNLGLEVLRGTVKDGDRYNYITHTNDGKILRSTSMYFKEDDKVIGCLCINNDITEEVRFENYLRTKNNYDTLQKEEKEVFVTSVRELLDHLISDGENVVGKPTVLMNKQDKVEFLRYLDKVGAFLITKSTDKVSKLLGISKATLYSYLEMIHNENKESEDEMNA